MSSPDTLPDRTNVQCSYSGVKSMSVITSSLHLILVLLLDISMSDISFFFTLLQSLYCIYIAHSITLIEYLS